MKTAQAICIDGEWFAVVTYRDSGESYRLRCRDQEHAESVALRETM
ncbi:hypothetical protein ACVBR5_000900 [Burkholderia cenocepacia]